MQNKRIYTISQLNVYLKNHIDAEELLHNFCIRGEVADFSLSGAHAYFTLKEDGAQISCVYFDCGKCLFKDGESVILVGSPKFYVKGGKLNFNVARVERTGQGQLFQNFLLLKKQLEEEGLFDKKIPMPKKIHRIGVVTSPTGAVIRDIINVVSRRSPNTDIVVYPVRVQGGGAENEIAYAINELDNYKKVDIIILARGGGSLEDLAPFNTETAARAVAACKKFIVSGVGHETDFTLCDFASDLRAPTPSAAAELVTTDKSTQLKKLEGLVFTLDDSFSGLISYYESRVAHAVSGLKSIGKINVLKAENKLKNLCRDIDILLENKIRSAGQKLKECTLKLELNSPLKILRQGYAKILADGAEIASIEDLYVGRQVDIRLKNGTAKAEVKSVTADISKMQE